jgi:hypothetical protein
MRTEQVLGWGSHVRWRDLAYPPARNGSPLVACLAAACLLGLLCLPLAVEPSTLNDTHTPLTAAFSAVGAADSGWYASPVSVTLDGAGSDSDPGPGSGRLRSEDGFWQDSDALPVHAHGTIVVSYYSLDLGENMESAHMGTVQVDRTPPSSYAYSDGYSPSPSFTVHWDGSDAESGIDAFDVQCRSGTIEPWQDWVVAAQPTQKSRIFAGVRGRTYYFRARATDKAGNLEPYPPTADTYVSVDPLLDGDFERDIGSEWETGGVCPVTQKYAQSYAGGNTRVAVLGCPDQENAPFGESMICQTIAIPGVEDMPAPRLQFRYRIFTYDLLWGEARQQYYDSFNVGVGDPGLASPTYVFTDGNRSQDYGTLIDLGWRQGSVDLSPYMERTMKVCLANVTRQDSYYNTWTSVDDMRVMNVEHGLYLAVVLRSYQTPWHCAAEPANDSRLGACGPLVSGQVYRDYIESFADGYDWFYFDMPAPHTVEAWLTEIPAGNDYELYLMDANGSFLAYDPQERSESEHIVWGPGPAGRYYLVVFPADNGGWNADVPYALRVEY